MDFEVTEYKRCAVMKTNGRIDSYTAPEFEEALNQLMEKNYYNIILDMSDVNFVSSAGWWAMIRVQKDVKKFDRGELVLVNLDEKFRNQWTWSVLRQSFNIYDELLEAKPQTSRRLTLQSFYTIQASLRLLSINWAALSVMFFVGSAR